MPDKPKVDTAVRKIERARKLLDQGRNREALNLALDALVQALDHLYNSLISIQQTLDPALSRYSDTQEEKPHPGLGGRPEKKLRFLH